MAILVGGDDSVSAITQRARPGGHGCVEQWSERKTRDLTKAIPIDTEAMELVLDRVNHTLARKVRTEATADFPSFHRHGGARLRQSITGHSI
ncbi:MAG: hypothetical protein ACXW39_04505 [Nitrospira sp.]